jgi:hypothetical protein
MQTFCPVSSRLQDGVVRRPLSHDGPSRLPLIHGARHLRSLGGSVSLSKQQRRSLMVQAKEGKKEPPDVPKPRDQPRGGKEWLQTILSRCSNGRIGV